MAASWLVMMAAVQGLASAQSLFITAFGSCVLLHMPSLGGKVLRLGLLLLLDFGGLVLLRESAAGVVLRMGTLTVLVVAVGAGGEQNRDRRRVPGEDFGVVVGIALLILFLLAALDRGLRWCLVVSFVNGARAGLVGGL